MTQTLEAWIWGCVVCVVFCNVASVMYDFLQMHPAPDDAPLDFGGGYDGGGDDDDDDTVIAGANNDNNGDEQLDLGLAMPVAGSYVDVGTLAIGATPAGALSTKKGAANAKHWKFKAAAKRAEAAAAAIAAAADEASAASNADPSKLPMPSLMPANKKTKAATAAKTKAASGAGGTINFGPDGAPGPDAWAKATRKLAAPARARAAGKQSVDITS
jgi:hypothetical protein